MDCNALDILSDLQSGHSGYQLIDGAVRCLTNLETHLHCTFNDLKIRRDVLGKSKKKKYGLYTRGRGGGSRLFFKKVKWSKSSRNPGGKYEFSEIWRFCLKKYFHTTHFIYG